MRRGSAGCVVPLHREIKRGTLSGILRQAGVYKSLLANFTPYVVAAVIFLAVTVPATRYADYLLNRQRHERS